MPTFVLIKQGKVVDKVVVANKDGLQKKIENNRAYETKWLDQGLIIC